MFLISETIYAQYQFNNVNTPQMVGPLGVWTPPLVLEYSGGWVEGLGRGLDWQTDRFYIKGVKPPRGSNYPPTPVSGRNRPDNFISLILTH